MQILIREFEEADREALSRLYVASRNAICTWNPAELHQASDFDSHTRGERVLVAYLIKKFLALPRSGSQTVSCTTCLFIRQLFVKALAKRC
jgi:hypothetical protein